MTSVILMIALSLHGLFEGTALGITSDKERFYLFLIAIMSHKWAEGFSLGVSFKKANTPPNLFLLLLVIFCIFTPIGAIIGLGLSQTNDLVVSIFFALSAGTFLYVSASEVIVEEFAISKNKFSKYVMYLLGGVFIYIMGVFTEHEH